PTATMTRAKQLETATEKKEDDQLMAAFAATAAAIPSKKRKARIALEEIVADEQDLDDLDIKKPQPKQHRKKEGSASKTPKPASKATKALPDISDIQLYREETDEVPVYDDCNEIRRKIKAHMKTPGLTQAQFCRDLYAQLNAPKCKGIQSKQLTDFTRAKGVSAGAKSTVFYAAYVYFEKLRIAQGKPLTKHRMDMEALRAQQGVYRSGPSHLPAQLIVSVERTVVGAERIMTIGEIGIQDRPPPPAIPATFATIWPMSTADLTRGSAIAFLQRNMSETTKVAFEEVQMGPEDPMFLLKAQYDADESPRPPPFGRPLLIAAADPTPSHAIDLRPGAP
ncbi:hypothetical protein FALBO_1315, partial [Fusarium albosuccineum]